MWGVNHEEVCRSDEIEIKAEIEKKEEDGWKREKTV